MVTKSVRNDDAPDGANKGAPGVNQVESLKDLGKLAAVVEAPAAVPGAGVPMVPGAAPAAAPDLGAKDLAEVLQLARDMAAPLVEAMGHLKPGQTKEIWTDAVLMAIAEPAVELMERFGFGLGEALNKLGPYVGLLMGVYPPAMATWAAIKANAAEAGTKAQAAISKAKGGTDGNGQQ